MAKPSLESVLESAGVDVKAAKQAMHALDAAFAGEAGDIPEGAMQNWINQHLAGQSRAIFFAIGKTWESELEVPEDRKWEKGPKAAEIKAKMNEKKAAK